MCQTQITGMSHRRDEAIWQVDIAVTGDGVTVKTTITIGEAQADAIFEAINKWRSAMARGILAAIGDGWNRERKGPGDCGRCGP